MILQIFVHFSVVQLLSLITDFIQQSFSFPSSSRSFEYSYGSISQRRSVWCQRGPSQHQLREDLGGDALRQRTAGYPQAQGVHLSESFQHLTCLTCNTCICHIFCSLKKPRTCAEWDVTTSASLVHPSFCRVWLKPERSSVKTTAASMCTLVNLCLSEV